MNFCRVILSSSKQTFIDSFWSKNYIFSRSISSEKLRKSTNLNLDEWEAIIGLEIHAQINSKTKLFSSSSTLFNEPVNTNISLIDAAFPGTIPRLNSKCVDHAIATSLSLSGNVQLVSFFDRKHYFYPDLPAGYQITQHYAPISIGGKICLSKLDGLEYDAQIRIKQIQLEQDTGKSTHDVMTLVDLNRAGVGLMEIVTEPDIRTSKEAGLALRKLQLLLRTIGSSDGNMEEGSLRCDVNVSVHKHGTPFGTRCEIKNLNSVKFLMLAIDAEIYRQIQELIKGNSIIQETRGYDVPANKTFKLRTKETLTDYRYMPESDLPPLLLTKKHITKIFDSLPELPDNKKKRLLEQYNLSIHEVSKNRNSQHVINFIIHELFGVLNLKGLKFYQNPVLIEQLGSLIDCVNNNEISGKIARKVLMMMVDGDTRLPKDIIIEKSWQQLSDIDELEKLCKSVLKENPNLVMEIKVKEKENLIQYFIESSAVTKGVSPTADGIVSFVLHISNVKLAWLMNIETKYELVSTNDTHFQA
ncbi:9648_t:CDS:10 [Entrophospora sp. SA101]|nr:13866_t:CDS:10 [Entrophospora sp. SA101]CAJ0754227.1 11974_t:CDS:10 [Entrophospora sp. SA101]CAJ0766249.1 9648_t:CDS:10 [Entrophospora sp. SA101]CAJ0841863.1 8173_t:CDS:10 [Entrophospora sp. SA101]CAJ0843006.1 22433_t:CDS:10 [Entrophospora sp. SA101]